MEHKKHVFTPLEKKAFLDILKIYSRIIENKDTDGATLLEKNEAWRRITIEYNTSPHASNPATCKQLRRLWMNLKQRQKEAMVKERQHRWAIGGGPSSVVMQVTPPHMCNIDSNTESDTASDLITETKEILNSVTSEVICTPDIPTVSTQMEPNSTAVPSCLVIPSKPTPLPNPRSQSAPPPLSTNYGQNSSVSTPSQSFSAPCHKSAILEIEYKDRLRRANEIHELEVQLLKERTREAKAKADLAELLLKQQQDLTDKTPDRRKE